MYALYSLLTAAGMILLLPYFLARDLTRGKPLGHLRQRLGWGFPPPLLGDGSGGSPRGTFWIHAVSVGEVLAAVPLARQLRQRNPQRRLVVSTTTTTGQQLARERMPFADAVFYFPLDWRGPVRRAMRAARPAAVIIVETEIWPNFLRESRRAGVPVIFVNGRISKRSFRGYRRALRFPWGILRGFLKQVLSDASLFLMQSSEDAARLLELGADRDKVVVAGNLKYDFEDAAVTPLSVWLSGELARDRRPVLVAGSVMANEEIPVLKAFTEVRRQFPLALLILAPRKPERFDAAARLIEESRQGLLRRSTLTLNGTGGGALDETRNVLLLDSLGELASLYRLADAVFVGGSLVPAGGHNILEPAAFSKSPVFGPSMDNFREIAAKFLAAGAGIEVDSGESLAAAWTGLLADPERAARMGTAARELVEQNRGATLRALTRIEQVLPASGEGP